MSETQPPDPDAEREVDLRSAWTRITARWYLPVAGLLIGAILGVLASASGGEVFRAPTLLYLGPAVHDLGRRPDPEPRDEPEDRQPGHPLRGRAPGGVAGERPHARPAARATSPPRRSSAPARARTSRRSSRSRSTRPRGTRPRRRPTRSPNTVIGIVSTYVDQKIDLLNKQIASSKAELADIDQRVSTAVAQQQAVIKDKTISSTDKLIAISTYNNTISFSEQRRGTVQQELFQNQQLLSLAENVEKSKIVQPAVASKTTATSRRNAAADRRADRPAARSARRRGRRSVPPAKGRAERRVTGR